MGTRTYAVTVQRLLLYKVEAVHPDVAIQLALKDAANLEAPDDIIEDKFHDIWEVT